MKIPFTKMHGLGNDYIYIDCFKTTADTLPDPAKLAARLSPRRTSVGADGLVLILPSEIADARMRMFNADGSEAQICGNGLRCVGKYLYDNGFVDSEEYPLAFMVVVENGGYGSHTCVPILSKVLGVCKAVMDQE